MLKKVNTFEQTIYKNVEGTNALEMGNKKLKKLKEREIKRSRDRRDERDRREKRERERA